MSEQTYLRGTYIGGERSIKGERAAIMIADGKQEFERILGVYSFHDQGENAETVNFTPAKGTVLAQFDDPGTGFGFGWHPFTAKDFRLEDENGDLVELPE